MLELHCCAGPVGEVQAFRGLASGLRGVAFLFLLQGWSYALPPL